MSALALQRSDADLMGCAKTGDHDAFATLFGRYRGRAIRIATRVCRDEGRAQDAVQEAFVSMWHARTTYVAERGAFAPWAMSAVWHSALAIARRESTRRGRAARCESLELHAAPHEVAEEVLAAADAERMRALLMQLPVAQREVIVLAFYAGLTHTEIADRLRLPAGTVKGRMRVGLQKLRSGVEG